MSMYSLPGVATDSARNWVEQPDGIETYRFSISWPRVLPNGAGTPSRTGIDFYRRLAEGVRERGIAPLATLGHRDLPLPLEDRGGWQSRDTSHRFAEYAALLYDELEDLVSGWVTINEPWMTAFLNDGFPVNAPVRRDWVEALRVSHHVLLGHGLAVRAFRKLGIEGPIGVTLDLWPSAPASESEADVAAARRWDDFKNRWFLDPVFFGSYPSDLAEWLGSRLGPLEAVRDGDLELISQPIDFLGVNYYSRAIVHADPADGPLKLGWSLLDDFGWEHDYGERFGMVYLEHETQRRIPKPRPLWSRDVIAEHAAPA